MAIKGAGWGAKMLHRLSSHKYLVDSFNFIKILIQS